MSDNILEIKHLSTYFLTGERPVRAVDDLSYTVKRGEFAAIIGESGSGKTVSALSILRLIPYPPGLIVDGSTKKVLETLYGADNVTYTAATSGHGNITSVTLSPDVSAEPAAYLFLMKDGDRLSMIGTTNGLITNISDTNFVGTDIVTREAEIEGTWTVAYDDGEVASGS